MRPTHVALQILSMVLAVPALAQQVEPAADNSIIPVLMFATFGLVIAFAVIALANFLRKRSNREAFDKAVNPNHSANK
jgi:Na+(H+)/acetate symporter ActP